MTALMTPRVASNAGHILIISVGRYEDKAHEPLPGARLTAARLAEFWRGSTLSGGRSLGSLEILVSCDRPLELVDDHGAAVVIEPARFEAVKRAIRDWAVRCRDGSFGILHWIGHGETRQRAEEYSPRAPVLYTEDMIDDGFRRSQSGLELDRIVNGLQHRVRAPLLCFFDACQIVQGLNRKGSYPSPWDITEGPALSRPAVFLPDLHEQRTYCARPDQEVCGDFTGGALFSEAVRLALSRFGARRAVDDSCYAVHRDGIQQAAAKRIDRWISRSRELEGRGKVRLSQGDIEYDWPIVDLAQPHGMIKLKPPSDRTANHRCPITGPTGATYHGHDAATCWEADLPYDRDYRAELMRDRWGSSKQIATRDFDVEDVYREYGVG